MVVAVFLIYWPGLESGFLLDDPENLYNIALWSSGDLSLWAAITENASGLLRRPVSMLTFIANVAIGGMNATQMKATNIALHLICGALIYYLTRLILKEVYPSLTSTKKLGFWLAFVWMLLPMHASTVLYVVQRMTQLSTLFTLLSLIFFVRARQRLDQGGVRNIVELFLVFPILWVLAILSKENGVLVSLLAVLIEITVFSRRGTPLLMSSRLKLTGFFSVFFLCPMLVGGMVLYWNFETLVTAGYEIRDFTLGSRLMTESRILWSYISDIIVPNGPGMGVFHDDYSVSAGLFSPPSTLVSILVNTGFLLYAIVNRSKYPIQALGVFVFFAAHSLESSFMPLELYFEHRNYLPSWGVLIFIVGVGISFRNKIELSHVINRCVKFLLLAVVLVYAGTTHLKASIWGNSRLLIEQAVDQHPNSLRAKSAYVSYLIDSAQPEKALIQLNKVGRQFPDKYKTHLLLLSVLANCGMGIGNSDQLNKEIEFYSQKAGSLNIYTLIAFQQLALQIEKAKCHRIGPDFLIKIGKNLLTSDSSPQKNNEISWQLHYSLARLLAIRERFYEAVKEAELAWIESDYKSSPGILVLQLYVSMGDLENARRFLLHFKEKLNENDLYALRAVRNFEQHLR
jgi:hypothetical protein